jgi:hypothetical protein
LTGSVLMVMDQTMRSYRIVGGPASPSAMLRA